MSIPRGGRARLASLLTALLIGLLVSLLAASLGSVVLLPDRGVAAEPSIGSLTSGGGLSTDRAGVTRVRNVVVFLVDDMSDFPCSQAHRFLPTSSRWLRDRGTCYERASTPTPVCCPARAALQTGQYGHNNGVDKQIDARDLKTRNTIQAALSRHGIETYGTGKNLNGVDPADYYGPHPLRTGFDSFDFWHSYQYGPGFNLYHPDGSITRSKQSSVDTNGRFATTFLDRVLSDDTPFYLYDSFFAPHRQTTAEYGTASFPKPSAVNARRAVSGFRYQPERDARDKRPAFQHPHKHSESYYRALYDARVRAMYDVDAKMTDVFELLQAHGRLADTAVFFTSDNGYTDEGQDNWNGKSIPYPASTDVPLLAYYPGRPATTDTRRASLLDIAPTIAQLTGVRLDHVVDGHSLLSSHRRAADYFELKNEHNPTAIGESGKSVQKIPTWRSVRTDRWGYVQYYDKQGRVMTRELYDLRADPGMTRNLLFRGDPSPDPSPRVVQWMQRLLQRYRSCRGTAELGAWNPCP